MHVFVYSVTFCLTACLPGSLIASLPTTLYHVDKLLWLLPIMSRKPHALEDNYLLLVLSIEGVAQKAVPARCLISLQLKERETRNDIKEIPWHCRQLGNFSPHAVLLPAQ